MDVLISLIATIKQILAHIAQWDQQILMSWVIAAFMHFLYTRQWLINADGSNVAKMRWFWHDPNLCVFLNQFQNLVPNHPKASRFLLPIPNPSPHATVRFPSVSSLPGWRICLHCSLQPFIRMPRTRTGLGGWGFLADVFPESPMEQNWWKNGSLM